jgi:hypothetical protein
MRRPCSCWLAVGLHRPQNRDRILLSALLPALFVSACLCSLLLWQHSYCCMLLCPAAVSRCCVLLMKWQLRQQTGSHTHRLAALLPTRGLRLVSFCCSTACRCCRRKLHRTAKVCRRTAGKGRGYADWRLAVSGLRRNPDPSANC